MIGRAAVAFAWALASLSACTPSGPAGTGGSALDDAGAPGAVLASGPSEKVCQLTGQTDWGTNTLTTTQTQRFGLGGTDLGYPVEHNGRLALLFGDTWAIPRLPDHHEDGPPDDAGAHFRQAADDAETQPLSAN